MHDMLLCQISQSEVYIAYGFSAVSLLKGPASAQHFGLEISLVTDFGNDVAVVGAADDVKASQDVGMIQSAKNLDLGPEKIHQCSCTQAAELDDFDRYIFLCVMKTVTCYHVLPAIDVAKVALSKQFACVNQKILHFLCASAWRTSLRTGCPLVDNGLHWSITRHRNNFNF